MARTQLPVIRLVRTSATTFDTTLWPSIDNANGSFAVNDGATLLAIRNQSGGTATVTVAIPAGVDQDLAVASRTYSILNNTTVLTNYYPVEFYGPQLLINASAASVLCQPFDFR